MTTIHSHDQAAQNWRFRQWKSAWSALEGVSTIEFAIVAPILCFLTVGVLDFGTGLWEQMQVANAARAGAEYASTNGWNSSAIQTAVTSATSLSTITASPGPSQTCGCPDATNGVVAASCGSTCTSGATPGTYVTVYAQAPYPTILSYPGIGNPTTLSATAIARIQ